MSRTAVSDTIGDYLAEVTVISTRVYEGYPEIMPAGGGEYPLAVYHVGQPTYEQITMGVAGLVEAKYHADIWVVLGTPDMREADAESAQILIAGYLRSVFWADHGGTLGSTVYLGILTEGNDNLQSYKQMGEHPQITFRLEVTERLAANSTAA